MDLEDHTWMGLGLGVMNSRKEQGEGGAFSSSSSPGGKKQAFFFLMFADNQDAFHYCTLEQATGLNDCSPCVEKASIHLASALEKPPCCLLQSLKRRAGKFPSHCIDSEVSGREYNVFCSSTATRERAGRKLDKNYKCVCRPLSSGLFSGSCVFPGFFPKRSKKSIQCMELKYHTQLLTRKEILLPASKDLATERKCTRVIRSKCYVPGQIILNFAVLK